MKQPVICEVLFDYLLKHTKKKGYYIHDVDIPQYTRLQIRSANHVLQKGGLIERNGGHRVKDSSRQPEFILTGQTIKNPQPRIIYGPEMAEIEANNVSIELDNLTKNWGIK